MTATPLPLKSTASPAPLQEVLHLGSDPTHSLGAQKQIKRNPCGLSSHKRPRKIGNGSMSYAKKVALSTGLQNLGAVRLYKRLGFRLTSETETHFYMEADPES